ncbi:MAG: hypothetical protein H0V43_12645 [Gemmatimonadales bacterium]|nr:hypothetical protein [Gemmatimonadales bacterium]MBA3555831.1 hypothetical protein [Gemmatimonadales bacterium]
MANGRGENVLTEARLRELYAGRLARRPADRASCPTPEALQALVRREGVEEQRLRTLDHTMSCAACRADFDLLRTVERAGSELAGTGRSARRTWLLPAALAASLLLAVGIGRIALAPDSDDVVRSGPTAGAVQLLAPAGEATAGDSLLFSWRPTPGATRYRLEVLNASGDVLVEAETSDTMFASEAVRRLAPGDYQWWVTALGSPDPRRSELRPLRLTR